MKPIAQTNIQLYNQLSELDYDTSQIRLVADAYELGTTIYVGLYRGSGKTLIAHVVGTASILATCGRPAEVVAAGVLHAAYADGDFGRRDPATIVTRRCGRQVHELVAGYDELSWSYESGMVEELTKRAASLSKFDREVVIMRVANELEDYVDLATHYHGDSTPSDAKKGAEWRLAYMEDVEEPLVELSNELGRADLADEIRQRFAEVRHAAVETSLRTGRTSMWFQPPASYRRTLGGLLRLLSRRVRKARAMGVLAVIAALRRRLAG